MIDSSSDSDMDPHSVSPARDAERSMSVLRDTNVELDTLAPIGVFDSGVGGLTILTALRQRLPYEDYLYFGDTAYIPYGMRSEEEISSLTLRACHFLVKQGAKLIVVACNTASQAALNILRSSLPVPFVGVVPAVKPAARLTRCGRIGVAATNQAVQAAYLHNLIDEFADGIDVFAVGCPELVTLVEQGTFDGPDVEKTLRKALQPLLDKDVDVIVLGCTHFPALRPVIERIVGPEILVIDSGSAIARRVNAVLEAQSSLHPAMANHVGSLHIWCSGDAQSFGRVASSLLGYSVTAQHITL